ncbi:MAG: excinuclease ABC subunit UvrC [Ruminococcaceae bacterium]|nr:excinuclease ABC subunit UvrC [Oscillospiraceae bacterium]
MSISQRLRDKANSLPTVPGVYIMKDKDGRVIYVGKSKKLKNRVSSYFVGTGHTYKTAKMVSLVDDFDYIVCKTEIEALTLENVLIKKYTPKYNIRLKDSKSYPYIKVTAEEFPKLFVTRERKSDRARYFGPYQGTASAYAALEAVMKIFSLATCKRSFPRDIGKERPCIYKDMGRCIAPCTGKVSAAEYRELVRAAERVLSGNATEAKESLRIEMERASEMLEFERAAVLRDSITALDRLSEKQKVVADEKVNRDVFAIHISDSVGVLAMLSIRGGALINKNEFILSALDPQSTEEIVSLIAAHYDASGNIPKEVMLGFEASEDERALLSEYLSLETKRKVTVKIPERGDGRALCDMALENAKESARKYRLEWEREDKNVKRLSELLGLAEFPRRIEAYDISNIGNENIVASMVVYKDGGLKKSDYRLFKIKTTNGADDYGSMREALTRRLSHIGDGTASLGETPDLILVDGGDAHVGVAREVLEALSLDISVFGMVKDDHHKTRALTDGENDISIAKEFDMYAFIYNLQEEAHRFAVKSSQGAKIKTMTHSSLEKIEGIGPAKAKALLSAMPLAKIRMASIDELCAVKGIGRQDAERIYRYFEEKRKGK